MRGALDLDSQFPTEWTYSCDGVDCRGRRGTTQAKGFKLRSQAPHDPELHVGGKISIMSPEYPISAKAYLVFSA